MSLEAREQEAAVSETASERVTILMTPTERHALESMVASAGLKSLGAFIRGKVFRPGADPDDDPEVEALVDLVNRSNRRAAAAIDHMIASIEQREEQRAEREARIREDVETQWNAMPQRQREALARLLAPETGASA